MDMALLIKFVCAFAFVIGLMLLLPWVLPKLGVSGQSFMPAGKRRLKVVEYLSIDPRRKLILVRRDNVEHLLVVGTDSQTVIETNIPAPEDAPQPKETIHV